MKTLGSKRLLSIGLLAALAACGGNPVEVVFQAPFPAGAADLAYFRPRDQSRYRAASDTAETLLLSSTALVRQQWLADKASAHQLDSLGLPHQAGQWLAGLRPVRVRPLAADNFELHYQLLDTLFVIGGRHGGVLRRHQGWYYLSTPSPDGPARWRVARLAVADKVLHFQGFNPDSLCLCALDTSAVRLRREPPRLLYTLRPGSRRTIRQVSSYAGLWLPLGSYRRAEAVR